MEQGEGLCAGPLTGGAQPPTVTQMGVRSVRCSVCLDVRGAYQRASLALTHVATLVANWWGVRGLVQTLLIDVKLDVAGLAAEGHNPHGRELEFERDMTSVGLQEVDDILPERVVVAGAAGYPRESFGVASHRLNLHRKYPLG